MRSDELNVPPQLMAVIAHAISCRSGHSLSVCVRTDEQEELIKFALGRYSEVRSLGAQLKALGYELKIMHPVHTSCDFVLEPQID